MNLSSPPGITQHSSTRRERGLTLVEMMFAIAILAILITIGVPAMGVFIEKNRLKGAAEQLFSDLTYARSEAIKRNEPINVSFRTDEPAKWCYGIDEKADCDCTITNPDRSGFCALNTDPYGGSGADILKTFSYRDYPSIRLTGTSFKSNNVAFDPTRGTANGGTIYFQSDNGKKLDVKVSILGRIRICIPQESKEITGYPDCE